jgi:hypothetical protein
MERDFRRKVAMYEFEAKDLQESLEEEKEKNENAMEKVKAELKKNTTLMDMYKEKLSKQLDISR